MNKKKFAKKMFDMAVRTSLLDLYKLVDLKIKLLASLLDNDNDPPSFYSENSPATSEKVNNNALDVSMIKSIEDIASADDLDLQPIADFMEEYIGQIIVDISGSGSVNFLNIERINEHVKNKVIDKVISTPTSIQFILSKMDGSLSGRLVISPTKFGMFSEKLREENMDFNCIYRVTFYSGSCLEYMDFSLNQHMFLSYQE